jgi:hypothetical protein
MMSEWNLRSSEEGRGTGSRVADCCAVTAKVMTSNVAVTVDFKMLDDMVGIMVG